VLRDHHAPFSEGCVKISENGFKIDYIYIFSRLIRILESSCLTTIFRCKCKVKAICGKNIFKKC
jgi:hypothetical protein